MTFLVIMDAEKIRPLSANQIQLLKKTFRMLDTDNVTKRFYTTLFLRYPEVKTLFPNDLTDLATKLVSVFELVVHSFAETAPGEYQLQKEILVPLRNLGKTHLEKGVDNFYYPHANEILIQSMKAEGGVMFTHDAEEAWRLAFNHLTFAMLNKEMDNVIVNQGSSMREAFQYIKSLFKS